MDLAAWGIDDGYWDVNGGWHDVPVSSREAFAAALGADDGSALTDPLRFIQAGHVEFLRRPAEITLEDGTTVRAAEALPPDLPPGYHQLQPLDGRPATRLVVTPGRCHLPPDLHTWGWAVQLYAARSRSSWGIGDLGDLHHLGDWAERHGAGVLALNPLHAAGPAAPQQPSPYYPSSRCFRNPLYLRIEDVPGAGRAGAELDRLAALGRALNDERVIDRDRVWALKEPALSACFEYFGHDPALDAYLAEMGRPLLRFATYCAIAEVHGNDWRRWPTNLRRPDATDVDAFAKAHADRVGFHAWLQWLLDDQLASATTVPLIHDLAVGVDPGGADAWAWQDTLALDMRVGAPPDEFNTGGQDWGLPPFVPTRLRAAAYEPFVQTLRSAFRHAGGLRIDHVMGLFRLFWIPPEGGPQTGGYVRYPAQELLDLVALESHRARAFVVGEDLGTVEDLVRAELAERQVLSYRLLWFEPGRPDSYPEQAAAAVTTHDLPTVAGMWTGSDIEDQRRADLAPNVASEMAVRQRLRDITGLPDDAPVADVVVATYGALAQAPSRVVLATLDDALCVTERPNMPGTVDSWPNWSLALPHPIDDLDETSALAVGDALAAGRRA